VYDASLPPGSEQRRVGRTETRLSIAAAGHTDSPGFLPERMHSHADESTESGIDGPFVETSVLVRMRPGTGRLLAGTAFCPCGGGPFRVDSRWCPLVMLFLASKKGDRCR
jgi:hypothetical protein